MTPQAKPLPATLRVEDNVRRAKAAPV